MADFYGLLIASQGYGDQETPGKVNLPLWIHVELLVCIVCKLIAYHIGSVHYGSNCYCDLSGHCMNITE